MSNVAKLKKKAAEFEQKKLYEKALATYLQILDGATESEDVEVSLYNRVGDLMLRQGNVGDAVTYYEKAVDLYAEGGFFNNAIALCNKILRHSPGRTSVYYKLGKISAKKGFRSDAKQNFLEYADRMQKAGKLDEAFRALKEFADLVPDQDDVRQMLAEQLAKLSRNDEALEQLQLLHEKFEAQGRAAEARAAVERMRAIDPSAVPKKSGSVPVIAPVELPFIDMGFDQPRGGGGHAPRGPRGTMVMRAVDLPPEESGPRPVPALPPDDLPMLELPEPAELDEAGVGTPPGDMDGFGLLDADAPPAGESPIELPGLERAGEFAEASLDAGGLAGLEPTSLDGLEGTSVTGDLPLIMPDPEPTSGAAFGDIILADWSADDAAERPHDLALGDLLQLEPGTGSITLDMSFVDDEESVGPTPRPSGRPPRLSDLMPPIAKTQAGSDFGADLGDLEHSAPPPNSGEYDAIGVAGAIEGLPMLDPMDGDPAGPTSGLPLIDDDFPVSTTSAARDDYDDFRPIAAQSTGSALDNDLEFLDTGAPPPRPRSTTSLLARTVGPLRAEAAARPDDWELRRQLGEALLEDGDRAGGLAELEVALAGLERDGRLDAADDVAEEVLRLLPGSIRHLQRRVEYAVRANDKARLGDAYVLLADALFGAGHADQARAVYHRVLELAPDDVRARAALSAFDPAAASPGAVETAVATPDTPASGTAEPAPAKRGTDDDFVDLGDWLREDEGPKNTRMVLDVEEPVSEAGFDFADMLRQFKRGVAENVGEDDHESHYDLGVAYKEMGLVDEAIAEFQKALRGTARRARSHEALGHCFIEKGQLQVASTVLQRALQEPGEDDSQLVGVLYLLGYVSEALGRAADALAYYQRVFAVDIEFRDVAQRLSALERVVQ